MKGVAEATTTVTADLNDANGCSEITAATSSVYWESVANGYDCTADDNDCYKITSVDCAANGMNTCDGATDAVISYTCTTTIAFHALPTDGLGNTASTTSWIGSMSVIDDDGAFGATTTIAGVVDMVTVTAIEVTETEIAYGSVSGNDNTGNVHSTTTIINYGNAPLDSTISGEHMVKTDLSYVIPAEEQKFATSTLIYGSLTYNLSSTTPEVINIETPRPTSPRLIYLGEALNREL